MKENRLKDKNLIELFKKSDELYEREQIIRNERIDLQKEINDRAESLDILIGDWSCDNPYGVCIYDGDDYNMDYCLFCHEPDERK